TFFCDRFATISCLWVSGFVQYAKKIGMLNSSRNRSSDLPLQSQLLRTQLPMLAFLEFCVDK
ncbi:MAG: hypothetical protein WBF29_16285, partial [Syntrophobacteria bacterium]